MSLRFHSTLSIVLAVLGLLPGAARGSELRICADPDNLPFSNRAAAGFDDRIAVMIAHDLRREAVFVWARPRRGFLREQFNKGACDLLLGVPQGMRGVAVTTPYYTSSYVFVTPLRKKLTVASFSDQRLRGERIGLQILEEDLSPPSLPLIRAGYAASLVGFESFGDQEGEVVKAVADGRVGVAVVWGPVAGYFARRSRVPLSITPVPPSYRFSGIPFTYGIGFGVHPQDHVLLQQLNQAIQRVQPRIDQVLSRFAIPTVESAKEIR